jgi:hypothetical protein
MVGSIVLPSEVSLLLLVPTSQDPFQIKCAKNIVRYQIFRKLKRIPQKTICQKSLFLTHFPQGRNKDGALGRLG